MIFQENEFLRLVLKCTSLHGAATVLENENSEMPPHSVSAILNDGVSVSLDDPCDCKLYGILNDKVYVSLDDSCDCKLYGALASIAKNQFETGTVENVNDGFFKVFFCLLPGSVDIFVLDRVEALKLFLLLTNRRQIPRSC